MDNQENTAKQHKLNCPKCGNNISYGDSLCGTISECPSCGCEVELFACKQNWTNISKSKRISYTYTTHMIVDGKYVKYLIHEENGRIDAKTTFHDAAPQDITPQPVKEQKLEELVVSPIAQPSMPAWWDSRNPGEAFAWRDYICILQYMPISMAESMCQSRIITNAAFKKEARSFAKNMEYLYAMTVFYKPGCNPVDSNTRRPAKIYTLERLRTTVVPMFCCFAPHGHINMGSYHGKLDNTSVRKLFLNRLTKNHMEEVTHIGTIADAFKMFTGKEMKEGTPKGCLHMLILLLSAMTSGLVLVVCFLCIYC